MLELDSSMSETYGQQGFAYNSHFGCLYYQPLSRFNRFGDLERVTLRHRNRHSAKFWRRVLLPVIDRYRGYDIPKFLRSNAAFLKTSFVADAGDRGLSMET